MMGSDAAFGGGCAEKLRALAEPTRLAVVEALLVEPLHVQELLERVEIEQSLLSHHLRVLREMGLVEARREGRRMLYALAPGVEGGATERTLRLGCCQLSFEDGREGSR